MKSLPDIKCSLTQTINCIITLLLCVIASGLLSSCARPTAGEIDREILYLSPQPPSVKKSHSPAFLIKNPKEQYNRIGMPSVRKSADHLPEIYVDPQIPAIFFDSQKFTTSKGTYKNLIYRIHFEKVPFALNKINLTAGNNPGLLIIYTLDANEELLLITTVHTCGCFLAFFPTTALNQESFPPDWPTKSQWVYGHNLPSMIPLSQTHDLDTIVYTIESETHRISNVTVLTDDFQNLPQETIEMKLLLMDALYQLPYKDRTVSFFELSGPREGYVKNNTKILERLLISWWAFDFYVGEDKAFGSIDTSDTIFYTSLKFWAREESDMKNFPGFLSYWGWKF
ncbi:MAG: hypothetical protein WBB23_13020 [Desulforhopalus sp.]